MVLSPFVVEAGEDKGYTATSTLAGTRVRTDLKDIASSISVVTEQFLKDTGATNTSDLLVYTPSTEVTGMHGNFSGVAGTQVYQENTISATTRVRGLDSADNTRDYFLSDIPWDSFNVGRVDLQRGPNSILFGVGSPAGIVNTSLNDATFKTAYHYEVRVDEYGSLRNVVDLNQSIVPGLFAIRVAALDDKELYQQKPAFNNMKREYAALRFDPKLFGENSHTTVRVKYEQGNVTSNNPRDIPPDDDYSMWFLSGRNSNGNPNYNKIIINSLNPAQTFDGVVFPAGVGGPLQTGLGLNNQGRSFWPDIVNYYETVPYNQNYEYNRANGMSSLPVYNPSGTPIKTITAQINTAFEIDTTGRPGYSSGNNNSAFIPRAIPETSSYLPYFTSGGFFGPAYPGAAYYADIVIRHPDIFDFYKYLLDGPNKHEWQNWKAYNITVDQSFFNERLGIQMALDHQNYTQGAEQWMSGQNYDINIDVNATYVDGESNPNAGRPYAGNGASQPGLNFTSNTIRDAFRLTPTGELRATDFLGDTELAKIIGKQVFTGLYERDQSVNTYIQFAEYAVTPQYIIDNSQNNSGTTTGQLGSNRQFEWIAYLGTNLLNSPNGRNEHLSNIPFIIAPPTTQTVTNFNSHWNATGLAGMGSYVDPSAPFTYMSPISGTQQTGHQNDNQANYVGWQQEPVTWMTASDPSQYPALVQSANRTKYIDNSKGITWQGYLLGGDLVPTFGWRKDNITAYDTNGQTDPISGTTSTSFADNIASRVDNSGTSRTWGGVYHLPKVLTSKLPWDSTISVFYDHGDNFKADITRLSMAGTILPSETGHTKEYGITITTLHDKLTFKLAHFRTEVDNATLANTQGNAIGGLSTNAYFIADGTIWGYGWATYLQGAIQAAQANVAGGGNGIVSGPLPQLTWYGDFSGSDGYKGLSTSNTPAQNAASLSYDINGGPVLNAAPGTQTYYPGGLAVVNAWVNAPFPSTFFQSYSLSPNIIPTLGAKTGNLADSFPFGYNFTNGPVLGGGSSFGNHQTTSNNISTGNEVELQFQPTKNWNITVNYTHEKATRTQIDPTSIAFMRLMTQFYNGPGGQLRMWWNGGTNDELGTDWNNSLVAPYAVTMNQLGHAAPEVSPWRLNLVTTYTFDHGIAKGFFVGGAFRDEAGRIIGYRFNTTMVNSLQSDPTYANLGILTQGALDVNQPFYGKNDWHIDGWVGYQRKIARNVDWRIQVNLKSIGENNHLVTGRINPDGSIALARIEEGMGWQLTNSFDF